jgi:hypothetical protein
MRTRTKILYLHNHTYFGLVRYTHTDYCEQPNNELSAIINVMAIVVVFILGSVRREHDLPAGHCNWLEYLQQERHLSRYSFSFLNLSVSCNLDSQLAFVSQLLSPMRRRSNLLRTTSSSSVDKNHVR